MSVAEYGQSSSSAAVGVHFIYCRKGFFSPFQKLLIPPTELREFCAGQKLNLLARF